MSPRSKPAEGRAKAITRLCAIARLIEQGGISPERVAKYLREIALELEQELEQDKRSGKLGGDR